MIIDIDDDGRTGTAEVDLGTGAIAIGGMIVDEPRGL
jgi:hypothetical protein